MVAEGIAYEETGLPSVLKTTNERLNSTRNELEDGFRHFWKD
jgi:hypothetical protein